MFKKQKQKSQYLRYSYEENSFSLSAENTVTSNMDNTDIFRERCQVAFICCEVHLVSGLTKELAVPFFFKVNFPTVTTLLGQQLTGLQGPNPGSLWLDKSQGPGKHAQVRPLQAREPRDPPASAMASPRSGWPVPWGWSMFHWTNELEAGYRGKRRGDHYFPLSTENSRVFLFDPNWQT